MINGVTSSGAAGGNLDFLVDRGEVVVDRARADHQLFGNLCIGHSLRQQTQDLDFTGGQAVGIGGCWLRWEVDDCFVESGCGVATDDWAARACSGVMVRPSAHAAVKVLSPS